jgi:drug/metabolite transporter (DMT)-like permease
MMSALWEARLLLLGASALYGTTFSMVKSLGDTMPVGVSSTLRFGLAAVVTMPCLVGSYKGKDAWTAAWLGFEVGLWNSIGYVSQAVGLETTPACESAFICSLAVVTVPLLDCLSGKKLFPRQWIGAMLAVIGVAFLELGALSTTSMTMSGLLSLMQPFSFGMGFWRMEQAMQRFPNEAPRMTAAQLLAVFAASLAYGLWAIDYSTLQSFPWSEWRSSPGLLFEIFWTGVITTALTIYMENLAMKTLSAAETTLIFSTEPLWGTAFAAAFMGEQIEVSEAIGAIFILTACIYSTLGMEGIKELVQRESFNKNRKTSRVARIPPCSVQSEVTRSLSGWKAYFAGLSVRSRPPPSKLPHFVS